MSTSPITYILHLIHIYIYICTYMYSTCIFTKLFFLVLILSQFKQFSINLLTSLWHKLILIGFFLIFNFYILNVILFTSFMDFKSLGLSIFHPLSVFTMFSLLCYCWWSWHFISLFTHDLDFSVYNIVRVAYCEII